MVLVSHEYRVHIQYTLLEVELQEEAQPLLAVVEFLLQGPPSDGPLSTDLPLMIYQKVVSFPLTARRGFKRQGDLT